MGHTRKEHLKVGQFAAFRQTGVNTGEVIGTSVNRDGWNMIKLKGTKGSRGATISEHHAVRIPGPDEVIVSRAELKQLEDNSDMLNRLEAAGVDNWEGYDLALRGNE